MRNLLEETRLKKQKNQLTLIDIWGRVSMAYVDCVFIFLMMPGLMGYKHTFTRQLAMSVERRWRINGDEGNKLSTCIYNPSKTVWLPVLLLHLLGKPFQRGFYCDDASIRYPFKESTVTNTVLYCYGLGLPIASV